MAIKYSLNSQTFSLIREEKRIYVDKTALIYELINEGSGRTYFLSRPRRFGKSLLISTLLSIFEGRQDLFEGLFIYDKIKWKSFPIIYLTMDKMNFQDLGLKETIISSLYKIGKEHNITLVANDTKTLFEELIVKLSEKYGKQVVILIDEYDSPITQPLEKSNFDKAEENRDILKTFYGALKPLDKYIRFIFITGITKFTKVSIFSELNHLTDLTLHNKYTTLLGYTEAELVAYFSEGIEELGKKYNLSFAETLAKIKEWYNGFSWDGVNFVYNPFSFMQVVSSSQFSNYWFQSGTPSFLIALMKDAEAYNLENIYADESIYDNYDFRRLNYKTLLLQTGYLTIKHKDQDGILLLDFPNKEVKESFNGMLLGSYVEKHPSDAKIDIYMIQQAFKNRDINGVMKIIETLFSSLPYHLFDKKLPNGEIASVGENFYHAVIYLIFNLLGVKMNAEVAVRNGRIDAEVITNEDVYLFEFKKDNKPLTAIKQMQNNKYYEKYMLLGKKVHLIGASFSLVKRGLDKWKVKDL